MDKHPGRLWSPYEWMLIGMMEEINEKILLTELDNVNWASFVNTSGIIKEQIK